MAFGWGASPVDYRDDEPDLIEDDDGGVAGLDDVDDLCDLDEI